MAEGDAKSRPVLGDVTNRIGKRGVSGREKNGDKCLADKDNVKRICVSPRSCSEINLLKGNLIAGLSKLANENRDPDVLSIGSGYAVSKSSTGVYDDRDGGHCEKGSIQVRGGDNDIKNLDVRGGNAVSQSVNVVDVVDDELGDSCDQIEYSKDDPNVSDKGRRTILDCIASEADDCNQLELDSLKGNKILGVSAEALTEDKSSILGHSVRENVVDLTIIDGGGEFVMGSSEMHVKENDPNMFDFCRSDTIHSLNTEGKDGLGDSFSADTSKTVSETGNHSSHDGKDCDGGEVNISLGGAYSDINSHQNDLDDHNADNFVLSQSGSHDCTILPQSQESRVFGIDRSAKLKEDERIHMTDGTNSIGACSCSFCTKAACIWLDLQQKDMKARISALKKSQNDASMLAERSCRIKFNEKHGSGSVSRVSKLESHLMHQWRSLYKHMANIWEEESNQLEASLLPLNALRVQCKADLELINAKHSEKH